MNLIDKDALVAEIERLISNGKLKCQQSQENNDQVSYIAWSEHIATLGKILSFIYTLEVKEVQDEPVSEDLEEAADNALNNVLNAHEIVNVRSCMEMFKYGAQWKEKETLQEVKEKLLYMLNTSIDNKHFFEQLDDYIDELENK